jgi:hypothetical protein
VTAPTRPLVTRAWIKWHGIEVQGWTVIYTPTDPADSGMHTCLTWRTAIKRANRIARKQGRRAEV